MGWEFYSSFHGARLWIIRRDFVCYAAASKCDCLIFKLWIGILEIVNRPRKRFQIVKWRWIVERSFGWLNWHRRLSKDYEYYEQSAEGWIELTFINAMIHRLQPG